MKRIQGVDDLFYRLLMRLAELACAARSAAERPVRNRGSSAGTARVRVVDFLSVSRRKPSVRLSAGMAPPPLRAPLVSPDTLPPVRAAGPRERGCVTLGAVEGASTLGDGPGVVTPAGGCCRSCGAAQVLGLEGLEGPTRFVGDYSMLITLFATQTW
jgi:hypothetical protein